MNTELAVAERVQIIAPAYSSDQMQLLVDTIAKGCDPNEFKLFLEVSKLTRLNPFTGQIRPVKRWNSDLRREAMVVQTGIDGYRAIASRTGDHAGTDDAIFDSEENQNPRWAKVTVYRWNHGERASFTATARWTEYVQIKKGQGGDADRPNAMWTRMPYLMLAKCAEALALRKAFPDELSGIYTEEEMGQADNEEPTAPTRPQVIMPSRTSERREPPRQEAQQPQRAAAPPEDKVSGVIESIKENNGKTWVVLGGKNVCLKPDLVDDFVKVGATLAVRAKKFRKDDIDFYIAEAVLDEVPKDGGAPPAAASAEEQAEFVQELDSAMSEEPSLGKDIFEGGDVKKASDLPASGSGKIGPKRAQRLYAMCNQNKATNNGLNEVNLKKIIAQAPLNLEHLSDLPIDQYENFEKLATGQMDWRPLIEE